MKETLAGHELIKIIGNLSMERLEKISPKTVFLKNNLKKPLFLIILGAALQSAFTTVMLKCCDIFIQLGLYKENPIATVVMGAAIVPSSIVLLHLLNLSFKFYDQMEVTPIYNTLVTIVNTGTGLIILEENVNYKWSQIIGVLLGVAICSIGVAVIVHKPVAKIVTE